MATKIYIDQGHNPQNPNAGAEGNGYREQDISYEIGVLLADILEERGFETRLSRNDPTEIIGRSNQSSLSARVNDANAWGADYFISLHTNASASPAASGTEALVYSLGTESELLAESILIELNIATGLRNRGVVARPGLYVLRRTRMPAVLVEMGFITNRRDADLMANSPGLFAEGIANGISDYLGVPVFNSVYTQNVQSYEPPYERERIPEERDPENGDSATDGDEVPSGERYEDFLRDNPALGYLKVQAYRGNQVYPVGDVKITVSKSFADGEKIFFEGVTDPNGIIDGIELAAPPRRNSLSPETAERYAEYELLAEHPLYKNFSSSVAIYDGVKALQPIQLMNE